MQNDSKPSIQTSAPISIKCYRQVLARTVNPRYPMTNSRIELLTVGIGIDPRSR